MPPSDGEDYKSLTPSTAAASSNRRRCGRDLEFGQTVVDEAMARCEAGVVGKEEIVGPELELPRHPSGRVTEHEVMALISPFKWFIDELGVTPIERCRR